MERTYFFELDLYGVSLYEEEIPTARQQRFAAAIRGPSSVLFQLGSEDDWDLGDNDDADDEPERVQRQGPANEAAGAVMQLQPRTHRKLHKFTPGQLSELQLVFQQTRYPDSLKRRELAQLFNVDEKTVMYWFNNKRAKIRRDERLQDKCS